MVNEKVHIIMPVKDSIETTERAIRTFVASGHALTVYDDYSTVETATRLNELQEELGIRVIHISDHLDHPSPNYRWVLIQAQREAIEKHQHLVIIESDVIIRPDTISRLQQAVQEKVGMVAAVTENEAGEINFPYEYARKTTIDGPRRSVFHSAARY